MPEIDIIDHSLIKNTDDKELSVQIDMSGFSFCVCSAINNNILAFRSYRFSDAVLLEDVLNQTESILEQDSLLKLPFKKTRFLYINRKSTLIPNEFFQPELLKRFMDFNQPIDDLDELHYNDIDCINSKVVFALPTYMAGIITDKFKNVEFLNQAKPLIEISIDLSANSEGDHVIINLNKEFFDMIVYKKGKLCLCNSFLYVNSSDLLYFVLFVCKQLNTDYTSSVFYLTGEQSYRIALVQELSTFIKNIQKPEFGQTIQGTIKIPKEIQLRYATLFKIL
jgi:hypothetical protein